jgi:serine/threonine-protein kinase
VVNTTDRVGEATTLAASTSSSEHPARPLGVVNVAPAPAPDADFELGPLLGEGGMGRVLSARQTSLDRPVATKFLRNQKGDPAALIREALVTGRLEHPNIVPVHMLATTSEGAPFFAMKRVEGIPWNEALAAGQPLVEALEVLTRVCDAVSFAHAQHVLHRDIKPANVLVGAFGEVYLVDWGLAVSLVPDPVLPLASAAGFAGTPAYLAPEMAKDDSSEVSAQSDVYLLGATLYEVLTGQLPHQGSSPAEAVAVALAGHEPTFEKSVPRELAGICRRAMAKAPADRFPGVRAFRQALTDYLRHREALAFFEQAQHRLVQLEQVTLQKVKGLEGSVLGLTAHAAFSECRFGFEQVRRLWPEFEDARHGLQKALRLMAEHEVAAHDARAARILLAQLEVAPRELVAAIEREEEQQKLRMARFAILEHESMDREVDLALGEKRNFALAFGVMALVGSIAIHAALEAHLVTPSHPLAMLVFGVPLVWSELFSRVLSRQVSLNLAQRRLVNGLKVSGWGSVSLWSLSWAMDVPVLTTLAFHYLFIAFIWLITAVLFHRRAAIITVSSGIAAVLSALFPPFTILFGGVCSFLGFATLSWTQAQTPTVKQR